MTNPLSPLNDHPMVSVSPNHQHYHQQNTSAAQSSRKSDMEGSFTTTTTAATAESPLELEYKQLKRKMKEITELNAAMNRDYIHAKKKIRTLTFERNLLLDNIGRIESSNRMSDDSDSDLYSDLSDTDDDLDVTTSTTSIYTKPKILKRLAQSSKPRQQSTPVTHTSTFNYHNNDHEVTLPTSTAPKRSKTSKLVLKTRRVQPIDRDEDGHPKLPQQIGVLTVLNLGTIITDRPSFHNERYIFPVGYTVSRTYPSMLDPNSNTVITSTIIDGGDSPRFHVVAADMPDEPIIANSATGAWTVVVRRSNEIRHREHSNSASGPDYYGFKHPTIASLIQDLPGAKDLEQYVWQTFEEMEPRAAKGVMAAAEKKRDNLEQMGNANRKVPKEDGEEEETAIAAPEYVEDEDEPMNSDPERL